MNVSTTIDHKVDYHAEREELLQALGGTKVASRRLNHLLRPFVPGQVPSGKRHEWESPKRFIRRVSQWGLLYGLIEEAGFKRADLVWRKLLEAAGRQP